MCLCLLTSATMLLGVSHLVPSTKQLTVIYLMPRIVENKELKKIPPNIIKFVNQYLEKAVVGVTGAGEEELIILPKKIKKKAQSLLK